MNIEEINKSLIKRYRGKLFALFVRGLKDFNLLQDNDCVGVCISGGKDSFTLAKLMQEITKHKLMKIDVKYLVMDPGYSLENIQLIKENATYLNLPIIIKQSNIFEILKQYNKEEKPCYLCARMRRGFLYKFVKEQGCNKIALGHHKNDVIETTLLNMFYNGSFKTMLPKAKSENYENMSLIRPMVYIEEKSIVNFIKHINLEPIKCACPLYEMCDNEDNSSKRKFIKELIKKLKINNPNIEDNIFQSANNVNIECVYRYKDKNGFYSYMHEED